jgi:hypothetical protein
VTVTWPFLLHETVILGGSGTRIRSMRIIPVAGDQVYSTRVLGRRKACCRAATP